MMHNLVHPGEVIYEDVLSELEISVAEAARSLGVSRVALSRVPHGHAAVSPNFAIRFELAGIGTAKLWLDMQTAYDLAQIREDGLPDVKKLVQL
ncbi:HigA family addiction module antitoxin [Corynebacterium epidermidicanis]|uniref:Addiction module antidote protein, HigA family n=1 Tax=Corynebacterium epidermidicanis TaxID=1050174 RepID=A0A0G3GUC3_9CORY|nr:HigA family addiction module antitoxin [Corynebacterium epidermidicanis]AKK03123.1 addiction module antidote protein, HigA family [Corynebacterium epidermidicanis]